MQSISQGMTQSVTQNLMSFSELSLALGARLFAGEGKQNHGSFFTSVSIDSRTVKEGGLFVALRGNVHDGHRFVEAAFKAGALGAVVDFLALSDPALSLQSLAQKWNRVLVAVEDTLKALQEAAKVYLKKFSKLLKIGITGSSGKTTTKEIAAAMIAGEKRVVMNKGNMNSETGLPLSVFDVRPDHEVGIFEAGMNRPGEIGELAEVLDPDIALITNIGSAHIGILGSRLAIAEEKKKIFSQFRGNNTALIPEDDDYRDFLAKDLKGRVVFFGPSSLSSIESESESVKDLGLEGTEIVWEGEAVRFGLPGKFNLLNAVAAAAIAKEVPVSSSSIRAGLGSVKPIFGRGEILRGRVTLLRDCYNANPESMEAALDFCDSLDWPGRRVYILGSLLELGDDSEKAHEALGRRLCDCRGDMIFLFGEEAAPAKEAYDLSYDKKSSAGRPAGEAPFFYTRDKKELSAAINNYLNDNNFREGDLVLLKGSRGCELEDLTGMILGGNSVP